MEVKQFVVSFLKTDLHGKVRTENKWPKLTVPTASLNEPYPGSLPPPAQHTNPTRQMDYKCVDHHQESINLNMEEQKLPKCNNWAWEAVPFSSQHLSSGVTAQSTPFLPLFQSNDSLSQLPRLLNLQGMRDQAPEKYVFEDFGMILLLLQEEGPDM